MNENFPNRETVVVRDQELHVVRRLPRNAEVKVRAGERISSDHVIARTDPRHLAVRIAIADQLGIAPSEVAKCMLRPVGSTFAAGEAIAKTRKGLRNTVVAAPMKGTLLALDHDNGIGLLAPGSGGDVRALVAGDVEFVDGQNSVAIRTVGSRMFGIAGIGPSAEGLLTLAVTGPGEIATPDRISSDMAGKVVVVGASIQTTTLRRLIDVGAVGVITGGIVEREVSACFVVTTDDRLAAWRIGPSDSGMGDNMRTSLAIVATEGFGSLPINGESFDFLRQHDGQKLTVITTTRTSGFLARPQIVHVNEAALDDDAPPKPLSFSSATRVRLIDPFELGMVGTVAEMPKRIQRSDGSTADVMLINCGDGKSRTVPLNNVEILA